MSFFSYVTSLPIQFILLKSTEKGNWKFVLFVLCSVLHIFLEVFLLVLKCK